MNTRLSTVIICALLLTSLEPGFAQTDTHLLATGAWSDIVHDGDAHATYALRGRLIVYDDQGPSSANHARIYLELQSVFEGGWSLPLEINFNIGCYDTQKNSLVFEMRDAQGKPIPIDPVPIDGPMPYPYDVLVPCDATIRLRTDIYLLGPKQKPDGLEVFVNGGNWVIHPKDTKAYFLSATLTVQEPPLSSTKHHVWQGILHLPAVKIPAKSP